MDRDDRSAGEGVEMSIEVMPVEPVTPKKFVAGAPLGLVIISTVPSDKVMVTVPGLTRKSNPTDVCEDAEGDQRRSLEGIARPVGGLGGRMRGRRNAFSIRS